MLVCHRRITLTAGVPLWMAFLAAVTAFAGGCAANRTSAKRPAGPPAQLQTATKQQLIASYNDQANAIRSINASISIKLTAGTAYSGIIKQYHEVKGFILAQKPASIRVIGQAPIVGTNIFDMASDGETFHIYIPSKNKFLEGPAILERESAQPIENLRPQHLTEAFFWTPIAGGGEVLFEAGDESEARYYILTIVQAGEAQGAVLEGGDPIYNTPPQRLKPINFVWRTARLPFLRHGKPCPDEEASCSGGSEAEWLVDRKVWFDRVDLSVARIQVYDAGGNVISDIRYAQWGSFGTVRFARRIEVTRPAEDYALEIGINNLSANEPLSADKFELKQPEGAELVHVGEDTKEPKP
jgi:outer membrane lipoprotein-sorting protein